MTRTHPVGAARGAGTRGTGRDARATGVPDQRTAGRCAAAVVEPDAVAGEVLDFEPRHGAEVAADIEPPVERADGVDAVRDGVLRLGRAAVGDHEAQPERVVGGR